MPPTVDDRLKDISESIAEIQKLLTGVDFQTYSTDRMLSLATERLLEIVCEASRTLPDEIKTNAPDIDWRKMIDFASPRLPYNQRRYRMGYYSESSAVPKILRRAAHCGVEAMMGTRVQSR
jgi:hypothetical protein